MQFAVTQLRVKGVRMEKAEIAAAPIVLGDLTITDWLQGNASGRALRQAQLSEVLPQYTRQLLSPVFDPVLIRMQLDWFILKGFQIESVIGGDISEHAQEWLVRVVTPTIEGAVRAAIAKADQGSYMGGRVQAGSSHESH